MARLPMKGVLRCDQSTDLGKQQTCVGNGVIHAEAITAWLPASKPEPTILERIDAGYPFTSTG